MQVLKTLRNGLLKIDVSEENLKHLLYPPADCMIDNERLIELTDKASLDLTVITTHERTPTLEWVLCHSGSMIKTLNLSRPSRIDGLDYENIMDVFEANIDACYNLLSLTAKKLGICQFPRVATLSKLKRIDLSDNEIDSITVANLPAESLSELDVSMNPIVQFNAELCDLKKLQKLRIGSPESMYICYPLLHKAVSGLKLSVHESSSRSLLFPLYDVLESQDKLGRFVRERAVSLQNIDKHRRQETIDWLFTECNVDLKSFDFTEGNELDISKLFVPSTTIEHVAKVILIKCQLKSLPHLAFLKELIFLDISDNNISILEQERLPPSLKELRIVGNPIKSVVIDHSKLSNLSTVHCGSNKTEYISSRLVEMVYCGDLKIYVPLEYEQYLSMPPSVVFSDREQLSNYVEYPERFVGAKADVTERLLALRWLTQDGRSSLNLYSQIWLPDTDLSSVSLKNIRTLTLSHCNLQLMPNFTDMLQLKCVDLSSNRFATICFEEAMPSLNTLNVSGNPISTIDFSDSVIPNLRLIIIGSPRTRFISREILKKVSQKTLILKVASEYRQYLWGPDWKTIENGETAISEYLNLGSLNVSHLTDLEQKKETLKYQLGQNIHFTEFCLSKERMFCEYLGPEDLSLFFHSLKYVKYLFLTDCGINLVPDWKSMSNLHYADLSGNNLEELPPNDTIEQLKLQRNKFVRFPFRQFPKLTQVDLSSNFIDSLHTDAPAEFLHTLIISENPVPDINFKVETFPNIQSITFGSSKTHYISDIVLSQFAHQKLDIQVSKQHRECLVMPNWTTISKGIESVREYLASTTLSVFSASDFDQRWKAIQWLLEENKRSITNLDMCHQEDVISYIGINRLEFLFKHRSLKSVASINLSDCRLRSLPDWKDLRYLKNANVSGNELVKIPRSGSLENLNISRNNIRSLSLSEADFPKLSHVTVGSEELQFIQFDTVIRIVDEGRFELRVVEEFRNQLIFPPLFRGNFDPSQYIKEPEKYLHKTEILKRRQATDWLMSEADFTFTRLDLSKQSELFGFYTSKEFCELFKNPNFRNIKKLYLNHCQLSMIPNIEHLGQLERLDMVDNYLTDVSTLQNEQLKYLDLRRNPIDLVHIDCQKCPNLIELKVGSTKTKDVSNELLQRICCSKLELLVDENYTDNVTPVVKEILSEDLKKKSIGNFLTKGGFDVTWYTLQDQPETYVDRLCQILSLDKRMINSLKLDSKLTEGFRPMKVKFLHHFKLQDIKCLNLSYVKIKTLDSVKHFGKLREIHLRNCNLTCIPDMLFSNTLEVVDIRDNNISDLNEDSLPTFVRKLIIDGNPIICVSLNCDKFQNLYEIQCGSKSTKYISDKILHRCASDKFNIVIPETYKRYLYMPPSLILDNKHDLQMYLKKPVKYVWLLKSDSEKIEGLMWIMKSKISNFFNVGFAAEKWIFDNYRTKYFSKQIYMNNLSLLSLNTIGLLDLSKLPSILFLEVLDVSDNLMQEIDFDVDSFPKLKLLTFGSNQTQFVALRILSRTIKEGLRLWVPKKFRKYLLVPSWKVLKRGHRGVKNYIASETLGPQESNQLKAIQWQLHKREKPVRSVILSETKALKYDDFTKLMIHPALRFVTEVSLSYCGIQELPEWNHLKWLKFACVRGNSLKSIPDSASLVSLDIAENFMTTLKLFRKEFPKLKNVVAGSATMQFISFELLRFASVSIISKHQKSLLLPPYFALKNRDHLNDYLAKPERFLGEVDDSKLMFSAWWLVNDADFKFIEIDLSSMPHVFEYGDESILRGNNLRELRGLACSKCHLGCLPDVLFLKHLETLVAGENNIEDVSTFKHQTLQSLDVTGNPIKILHTNFDQCPNLNSLTAGSRVMKAVSLAVLEKISSTDFTLHIDEMFKHNLLWPPPDIVASNFDRTKINEYLLSNAFDFSWYSEKLQKLPIGNDATQFLFETILLDGRKILSLKFSGRSVVKDIEHVYEKLLKHQKLSCLEKLDMNNCKITFRSPLPSIGHLTDLNLSGNDIGSSIDFFQNDLRMLQHLNLRDTKLIQTPRIVNMTHLVTLDIAYNQLTSLEDLDSKSLHCLTTNNNLFETLDFNPAKVPALAEVYFGSEKCKFISFPIIRKKIVGGLELMVSDVGKQYLLIPPGHDAKRYF